MVDLGGPNEITTSADGKWTTEIHRADAVFQVGMEAGGLDGSLRRADTSSDEDSTKCCYHVRHV